MGVGHLEAQGGKARPAPSRRAVFRRHPVAWRLGAEVLRCVGLVLAVSLVTFALVSASPIDPLQANLGQSAYLSLSEAERARLMAEWGLDQPFLVR